MNPKRKINSDADILKVFTDLGLETEEARERFRQMGKAQTLDVWGKRRHEPHFIYDDTITTPNQQSTKTTNQAHIT